MAKIALIVLLSFALILSAKPIVGKEEDPKDAAGGPGPAEDAGEDAADGVDISSDQLKKIGSEVKEAFQNIEDNVDDALSPEQEDQIRDEFGAPSPGEDDIEGDADAPSEEGGDAGAPSAEGGAAGAPSTDAPSPAEPEIESPKDAL